MRCNICNRLLNEPTFNKDLNTWEPCETCLAVIEDTIAAYRDRPYVDEDELGQETTLEELGLDHPFYELDDDFT